MKTKLELLGRTLLIFCTAILMGTFFSAIYMVAIDYQIHTSFVEYFIIGNFITGVYSIPTLLILFIGFYLIYRKCKNNTQKWKYITLIWLLTCYAPIILSMVLLISSDPYMKTEYIKLFFASIPYVFTSFISIFSFTYFFDKRKPPTFQQVKKMMNNDILDAPF